MRRNTNFMIDRSESEGDPISDLLRLASVQTIVAGELFASGTWAIRFPPPPGLKFFALLKGCCWLLLDGQEAVRVDEGDVVLMHWAAGYVLASEPEARPIDANLLFRADEPGSKRVTLGEGRALHQIGGHIRLDPE